MLREDVRETELREILGLTAKDVFAVAAAGDRVLRDYLDRIGRLNAAGIGALANAYNPGLVTISGGVALHNQAVILGGIRRSLDAYCYVPTPELQVTELGDYIGLYGALGAFAAGRVELERAMAPAD